MNRPVTRSESRIGMRIGERGSWWTWSEMTLLESSSRFMFVVEHDLSEKTGIHFSGSCSGEFGARDRCESGGRPGSALGQAGGLHGDTHRLVALVHELGEACTVGPLHAKPTTGHELAKLGGFVDLLERGR